MATKPILCLDFDGVIHSYASGWKGANVIPDPPVFGAIRFIEVASYQFTVAIYSSRSKSLRGRWAMKAWLERHVIEHFGVDRVGADDLLCSIKWPWFKPSAFVTLDDRAITFTGTWPDMQALRDFKSWVNVTGPIQWNPYNKVVQDHRDGSVNHDLTNAERARRKLPTPWSAEIAETEVRQPPVY